jgi:hypothetical protein
MGDLIRENMASDTSFESRRGILACKPEEFYTIISDIRNFEQFVPPENIKGWKAEAESCSFQIPPFGSATVNITGKVPYSLIVFYGKALQDNEFTLKVNITERGPESSEVKLELNAIMNPMLRMMAAGAIGQFLEKLITEMEKINWQTRFKGK